MSESTASTSASEPARRSTWLVLAVSATLLCWTASRVEGYRLADSVEYMDRAWDIVRGAGLGPESPRSFAFSALLLPFFALGEALGGSDLRWVVVAIRVAQAATALACVAVLMRIVARLAGRVASVASGLFLGLGPVFLQYATEPVSGIAAMLFTTLAFGALFAARPRSSEGAAPSRASVESADDARAGLRAGTWLGLAFLIAYRTLPILGILVLCALVRDRRSRPRFWSGLVAALVSWILAGCLLDLAVFGAFGVTLVRYLGANVGSVVTTALWELGLYGWAEWVYVHVAGQTDIDPEYSAGLTREVLSLQPRSFYLANLTTALASIPALALLALGALRAVRRPRWATSAAVAAIVVSVTVLSLKGSKSFRLLLPLLPLLGLVFGSGVAWIAGERNGRVRAALAWGAALVAVGLGVPLLLRVNLTQHGGFWRAMDAVESAARAAGTRATVGASYHWAVLFRQSADVQIEKLPHHLDQWEELDRAQRDEVLEVLGRLDFFITHLQAVAGSPELMDVIGSRYRIARVEWRPAAAAELGPVCVLAAPREGLDATGPRFFERRTLEPGAAREQIAAEIQRPAWTRFGDGETLSLVFAGWDVDAGVADGQGAWITLHWFAEATDGRAWTIDDRITDNLAREVWNHTGTAYGVHPVSSWRAGTFLSERYFVPIPLDVRKFGGPYGRGEQIPAELYVALREPATEGERGAPVRRAPAVRDYAGREPYRPLGRAGERWSADGEMLLVGGAWLPVPARRRMPPPGVEP